MIANPDILVNIRHLRKLTKMIALFLGNSQNMIDFMIGNLLILTMLGILFF